MTTYYTGGSLTFDEAGGNVDQRGIPMHDNGLLPSMSDPATWEPITVPTVITNPLPILPKKPPVGPATGQAPSQGNAIQSSPVSWGKILVAALVVGLAIWLIEQNVGDKHAMLLAVILLLGAAYSWRNFSTELQALTQGKI